MRLVIDQKVETRPILITKNNILHNYKCVSFNAINILTRL